MKRTFESGWDKIQKKRKKEEEAQRHPKIDQFFSKRPNQTPVVEQELVSSPQQPTCSVPQSISHIEDPPVATSSSLIMVSVSPNIINDIGLWCELSNDDKTYWIEKGPSILQHWEDGFQNSEREYVTQKRYCTISLFKTKKFNGEQYTRDWLCYSPSKGKVFCFVCKIFSSSDNLFCQGFNDWNNPKTINSHENSSEHKTALLAYISRKKNQTLIPSIQNQLDHQKKYMKQVLQRVFAVVAKLTERALPLRGQDEVFGSEKNGNFLGIMELLAEFDPFLAVHIKKHGNPGTGNPSYMSKTIYEEIIHEMAKKVRTTIIAEVKLAKYFSVSVDSTPDLSHIDQLTIIVRYVSSSGCPTEKFLGFIPVESHSGENLSNLLFNFLEEECGMIMSNLRGQSYDNAPNMAGCYNGMQAKVLERCPFAYYYYY